MLTAEQLDAIQSKVDARWPPEVAEVEELVAMARLALRLRATIDAITEDIKRVGTADAYGRGMFDAAMAMSQVIGAVKGEP